MLKVDLVSPSAQILSGVTTDRLLAPSIDGQITILPGHRDMICLLGKGLLFMEGLGDKYVVYGGILQTIDGENVTIAVDRITKIDTISGSKIDTMIKDIEKRMNNETLDDKEYKKLMDQYLDHIAELNSL